MIRLTQAFYCFTEQLFSDRVKNEYLIVLDELFSIEVHAVLQNNLLLLLSSSSSSLLYTYNIYEG